MTLKTIPPCVYMGDVRMRARWYVFVVVAAVVLLSYCVLALGKEDDKPPSAPATPGYAHYENEEFGFGFDYPEDWLQEEVASDGIGTGTGLGIGIGIKPTDSEHNQIQISVDANAYPVLIAFGESYFADLRTYSLEQFFEQLGANNLNILVNERVRGMWDWETTFNVTYEDTPLEGGVFVREKYVSDEECTLYSLFYVHSNDWPEGLKVVDSFAIAD